ncbi:MAG: lipoate--protein ligase family protein [Candidatus Micrarchaeota archaeon]
MIRLLDRSRNSGFVNMAMDEAIALNAHKTNIPTLSIYSWEPPTVTIGYFQSMNAEVDVDRCKSLGIDCIRRITGGGAVFHDKELTYSFVCTESSGTVSKDILESYKQICAGVIGGLSNLGIESQFAGINDIITNGKKISGNAQTRRHKSVLQHGTLLLDVDVEKMFSLLKVPNEKIRDKLVSDVKQRVCSVKSVLGRDIEFEETKNAVIKGFGTAFKTEVTPGELSKKELEDAEIVMRRIRSTDWNFSR